MTISVILVAIVGLTVAAATIVVLTRIDRNENGDLPQDRPDHLRQSSKAE